MFRFQNSVLLGIQRILLASVATCFLLGVQTASGADDRPPNIVLIFCDDLGYGDVGCYGSKVHRTPNIDRMATEGTRLTSYYVSSGVCTPSRSSLMTGCYPRRVNMHASSRNEWVLFPVAKRGLNPTEITIAEVLKQQGYATACVGKWHLGDQRPFLPTKQGFDTYFGIPYSNDMGSRQRKINPPLPLLVNETVIEAPVDQSIITRRYTEKVVEFITANKDKPFFVYLPHTMPHNPVNSSAAFKGKSANGGYGDSVEEIDWSTGQILAAVERLGIDENTLVIFTSDNGAAQRWGGSNLPLSGYKGSTMEGGMRVPMIARWPGTIPAGKSNDEIAASIDVLPTLAALAQGEVPQDRIIDGQDISHLFTGDAAAKSPHDAYYYYFRDQLQAVRSGKWKLHLARSETRRNKQVRKVPARLFDLDADIAEKVNLLSERADVVARLEKLAERARVDLGDRDRPEKNQRTAGSFENPVPLVRE